MADSDQTPHDLLFAFFAGEFAKRDEYQCTSVTASYAPPGGYREEEIRRWDRRATPDRFELAGIGELTKEVLDVVTHEVDAKQPGRHRFTIKTTQAKGGRATHSISLAPAFSGNGDESTALVVSKGAEGAIIANHANALMRVNQQMFDSVVRVSMQAGESLRRQNEELLTENRDLRRKLDEAESTRLEREFRVAQAAETMNFKKQGMQQLFQFGQVAMAHLTSGGKTADPDSALVGVLYELGTTFRPEQFSALQQIFDQAQLMLFMNAMNMVRAAHDSKEQKAAATAAGGTNGTPPAS